MAISKTTESADASKKEAPVAITEIIFTVKIDESSHEIMTCQLPMQFFKERDALNWSHRFTDILKSVLPKAIVTWKENTLIVDYGMSFHWPAEHKSHLLEKLSIMLFNDAFIPLRLCSETVHGETKIISMRKELSFKEVSNGDILSTVESYMSRYDSEKKVFVYYFKLGNGHSFIKAILKKNKIKLSYELGCPEEEFKLAIDNGYILYPDCMFNADQLLKHFNVIMPINDINSLMFSKAYSQRL